MKKAMIGFLGVLMMVGGLVSTSLAWERGTHAFIAEQLRKGGGPNTIGAMYASTCPDAFNYMFTGQGALYRDYFYEMSHFQAMSLWDAAKTGPEKNAARGFVSHNNVWGADKTAHIGSLTLLPNEGYVITKAKMVDGYLSQTVPAYAALMGNAPGVGLEICHQIVEAAGDMILKNADPTIGPLLMEIAKKPRPEVPTVMAKAYAAGLAAFSAGTAVPMTFSQAAAFIMGAEAEWRQGMIAYGYLMQADDATFKANLVEQFKALAAGFLAGFGIEPPAPEILQALIEGALDLSLYFCQADYMAEVQATATMVRQAVQATL
jgi:hypothetical protein